MEHIWEWWQDIFEPGRGFNGSILPSYTEIHHYAIDVLGCAMRPSEILGIRRLSRAYIEEERRKRSKTMPSSSSAPSTRPRGPDMRRLISMKDATGLKDLFKRQGARAPRS